MKTSDLALESASTHDLWQELASRFDCCLLVYQEPHLKNDLICKNNLWFKGSPFQVIGMGRLIQTIVEGQSNSLAMGLLSQSSDGPDRCTPEE
jgi:hypothetical protein